MSLVEVRNELANRLAALDGLRVYPADRGR